MDTDPAFDKWRKLFPRIFPDLKEGVTFQFTSHADPNYNCLSWALSCDNRIFDNAAGCLWPWKEIACDTPEGWTAFCEHHGFAVIPDNNTDFVLDIEKIAILQNQDAEMHATRQDRTGKWKSKLGEIGPDIDHTDLLSLRSCYGEVVKVLQRVRPDWKANDV
jgi:hypothetical protein